MNGVCATGEPELEKDIRPRRGCGKSVAPRPNHAASPKQIKRKGRKGSLFLESGALFAGRRRALWHAANSRAPLSLDQFTATPLEMRFRVRCAPQRA
jgi:hypothetical protein